MKRPKIDIFLVNSLLFLLPLIYLPGFSSYNTPRYFFFGTVVLILFIFTTYRFLKNKWLLKSFFKSWYSYGLIVYFLSFVLVSITSIYPSLSFFSSFSRTDGAFVILFLTLFSLSIFSILSLSSDKNKIIKQFLVSSVLGATILSIFIIISPDGLSLLNIKWLAESRGGAMTGNSSVAASYVIWNIFFVIILFIKSEGFKKKVFWIFSLIILTFSPLFINWHILLGKVQYTGITSLIGTARGAVIGIIFGFVIAFGTWLILQKTKTKKYIGIGLISIIFIGSVLGGISLLSKTSLLHQKFIESTSDGRFEFWDAAIEGFKEHPLLGMGPNTFSYSYHKFFNPIMLEKSNNAEFLVDRSHNIFFETINNGGILLFFALLLFIISTIIGLVILFKKGYLSDFEVSLCIGVLMGWLFQAQFVFDSILSLLMLFLLVGFLYGLLSEKQENIKRKIQFLSSKDKSIVSIVIVISIILFIYTIALPYKKNKLMFKAYDTNLPARVDLWGSFSGISPMGDHHDIAVMFNKATQAYDTNKKEIQTWSPEKREIVLREMDAILNKNFSLIELNGDYEHVLNAIKMGYLKMYITNDISGFLFNKTKELISRAKLMSPRDPQPYWVEIQLETASGNFIKAKELIEQAIKLEPSLEYTNSLALQLAKNMKDEVYYNFALKRAEENIPGFIIKE